MRNIFIIFTLLLVLLAACGGNTAESTASAVSPDTTEMISADDTAVTGTTEKTDTGSAVAAESAAPIDTASLDVCALLPEAAVTAVTGSLRETPEAAEFIGDERGCTYLTEEGFIYTINVVPLDRWEIMTAIFTDATAVLGLGDEAMLVEQSGDSTLNVLLDGLAVVQVYNTTSDTAVSTRLAQLTLDILAQ